MSKNQIKISKADAKKELEAQIQKGKHLWMTGQTILQETPPYTDQRVRQRDNFEILYNKWRDFTREMLKEVFVSTSYASDFTEVRSSKSELVGSGWVPDVEYYMEKQIIPKSDYLKILLQDIDEFTELAEEENQPTPSLPTDDTLDSPTKVTLEWLWKHVPVHFWVWIVGIVIAAFVFGITVGQISWVKELF